MRLAYRITAFVLVLATAAVTGAQKEFEVYGWFGLPDEHVSLERYREAREAGFTSLMQCAGVEKMLKYLDWAQAAGVKLGVQHSMMLTNPEPIVEKLKHHPAVRLWHLKDEPNISLYPKLAEIARRVKTVDPGPERPVYVNMNPIGNDYANIMRYMGTTNYVEYLERAIDEIGLPFLSVDHYPCRVAPPSKDWPFIVPNGPWYVSTNWYENLQIASDLCLRKNVPLSLFARSTSFTCVKYDHPIPTQATLRLEVYSALAYGARSIQYFTYYSPSPDAKPLRFHDGCIARDGRRGLSYDRVKAMNRELHARADERFTDANLISVAHTDPVPPCTRRLSVLPGFVKKLEAKGALVSHLRRNSEDILMVVNRDLTQPMRLDVSLAPGVSRILVDGEVVDAARYGELYLLEPGYAEIFIYRAIGQ